MNPFTHKSIVRLSSLLQYDWEILHRTTSREIAAYPRATNTSFFPGKKEKAYREHGVADDRSMLYNLKSSGLENTEVSRKYLEYYKQLPVTDEHIFLVSPQNEDYVGMYKSAGVERTGAIPHFPETYKFIRALPFKYISRAIIWLGLPNCSIVDHYDLHERNNPVSRGEGHFLLFDFAIKKEFWVRNRTGEKEYANDPVIFFDTSRIHGSDVVPYRNYLIRVDGIFTDEFHEKVGGVINAA